MPRAHRHSLAGHVWHVTHRCHEQKFLLESPCDRQTWLRWLHEARRRFDLSVLNYAVTCNHIHLLVHDRGGGEIARSMQLVAGRTAQQFNARSSRKGAFWDDRYHATAVQADHHLARCVVYIDLNMVRAGVVSHPSQWPHCGYHDIQSTSGRDRIVDTDRLASLLNAPDATSLRAMHRTWLEAALAAGKNGREPQWSDGVAVGNPDFLETVRQALWPRLPGRKVRACGDLYQLREPTNRYRR